MTDPLREALKEAEAALSDIAFMRPAGPTRSKLVEAMERRAIDARDAVRAALSTEEQVEREDSREDLKQPRGAGQELADRLARAEANADRAFKNAAITMEELETAEARIAELEADALRYRYLRGHHSDHYPMTWEQPAEWSIQWSIQWVFQQRTPAESFGTIDGWIDADIAALDDEDREALALPSRMGAVRVGGEP